MASLIVSVNVECDRPRGEVQARTSLRNLKGLPRLQAICERYGVKPTYFVSFPVLSEIEFLSKLNQSGKCELGALLQPWSTPPFDANEDRLIARTAAELPVSSVAAKVERLTAEITQVMGTRPRSHRAAGWGLNGALLQTLERLGYEIDSSVAPFTNHEGCYDWRDAPEPPWFPDRQRPQKRGSSPILEVPLSVGWSRELLPALARAFVHAPAGLKRLAQSAADYIPLPEIIQLDPSKTELKPMRRLARTLVDRGLPALNLSLSSNQCWPGESVACPEPADVEAMFERLEGFLRYAVDELRAVPKTLSGFADDYLAACG